MSGIVQQLAEAVQAKSAVPTPKVGSLMEFLTKHARVKTSGGQYVPYGLEGREPLIEIIETFDLVLGSKTGKPLADATLDICGGAQFGKTILALNIGAYVTACRWMNWGYYLPDDDLVQGIVDTKLRPDVIEQIPWLQDLMAVGVIENDRGKAVNRKGAFRVSDGKRKSFGMIRGMGKIPTSFSMDVAMEDEKDDIPDKNSKFLSGRMTASEFRMRSSIGTQRVYGRGQQKQWKDGSQGLVEYITQDGTINLEDAWPQVCRMMLGDVPSPEDPQLNHSGLFHDDEDNQYEPEPEAQYYLAHPKSGQVINRRAGVWRHLAPERIKQRHWSWRISQLSIDAISLHGIVARWQAAVKDPESMTVFCCDVLAKPSNTSQGINDAVIERSRAMESHEMRLSVKDNTRVMAGIDTGDRCWFVAREVESEAVKRVIWAEKISLGDMVRRSLALCNLLQPAFTAIDARPAASEARSICWVLNGLSEITWPTITDPDGTRIILPGGVEWNGPAKQWVGIKAAVVEFSLKPGQGIEWRAGKHIEDGQVKLYPVLRASREDSIQRVVNELLTPTENVIRVVAGQVLPDPVMRLPLAGPASPPASAEMARHFQVGSERDEKGEFVDKVENHLLLANAYSGLAEQVAGAGAKRAPMAYAAVEEARPAYRRKGGLI